VIFFSLSYHKQHAAATIFYVQCVLHPHVSFSLTYISCMMNWCTYNIRVIGNFYILLSWLGSNIKHSSANVDALASDSQREWWCQGDFNEHVSSSSYVCGNGGPRDAGQHHIHSSTSFPLTFGHLVLHMRLAYTVLIIS
jgi:hypothetical protein